MTRSAKRPRAKHSEVRLLPAVIGVGVILLALKAGGLAFTASAATAEPPTHAAAEPPAHAAEAPAGEKPAAAGTAATPAPIAPGGVDPLAAINAALPIPAAKPAANAAAAVPSDLPTDLTGSGVSSAEMDVLTSLADRRNTLDERQRELDLRANLIAATEKRVDGKIAQLQALQGQIEKLLGQRDSKETENLDSLVRVYTAMKPKDAARVFSSLDGSIRLGVAGRMKPDTMAGIMSALPSDVAQKLTVELASRNRMGPETTQAVAAAVGAASAATAPAPGAAPANASSNASANAPRAPAAAPAPGG